MTTIKIFEYNKDVQMSKKGKGRMVESRISVTKDTRNRFREFANGLGVEYDEAINFVLDYLAEDSEDALLLGRRLRDKLRKTNQEDK